MEKQCVSLFGITNDGDSKQETFIIPEYEAKHYGKGPNATCSYLYHKLKSLSLYP